MALVKMLLNHRFAVQLQNDGVETTWEDHGDVTIKLNDVDLVFLEKFQHNRKIRSSISTSNMEAVVANVIEQYKNVAAGKKHKK